MSGSRHCNRSSLQYAECFSHVILAVTHSMDETTCTFPLSESTFCKKIFSDSCIKNRRIPQDGLLRSLLINCAIDGLFIYSLRIISNCFCVVKQKNNHYIYEGRKCLDFRMFRT